MAEPRIRDLIPLIQYPEAGYKQRLSKLEKSVFGYPGNEHLNSFLGFVKKTDLKDLQELYIASFDMNPDTCLDIGWHLFGENYNRGKFLVKIRKMMREKNISETSELPDHLSNIFELLSKMEITEQNKFLKSYLLPALKKIENGFYNSKTPFKHMIGFLNNIFQQQFAEV